MLASYKDNFLKYNQMKQTACPKQVVTAVPLRPPIIAETAFVMKNFMKIKSYFATNSTYNFFIKFRGSTNDNFRLIR